MSVVDAFRLLQQFTPENGHFNMEFQSSNQVIINQIECCDVLLFNKIDLISPEEKKYLLSLIRQIQPHAKIVESTFCQVPISHVLNTHLFDEKTSFRQIASHLDNSSQIEKELAIQSFVYYRRAPFHPERFDAWLNRWPKEIIRCKRVVWFVTQPNNVIKISQSGRAMDTSHSGYWIASLKQWEVEQMMKIRKNLPEIWDTNYGDRMIELVFIGTNLNQEKLIQELDTCLITSQDTIANVKDPFEFKEV